MQTLADRDIDIALVTDLDHVKESDILSHLRLSAD